MKAGIITVILLIISNVFMTAAWYGNLKLKEMHISTDWPLILVILASWGVALIEYFFMIPANTIGSRINGGPFSLMQLKVIQEDISRKPSPSPYSRSSRPRYSTTKRSSGTTSSPSC